MNRALLLSEIAVLMSVLALILVLANCDQKPQADVIVKLDTPVKKSDRLVPEEMNWIMERGYEL
jgi:hypothetical protein